MAGYTDKKYRRATTLPIKSASIPSFNAFEFSRPMMRNACEEPIKVYSHISPYMGGPDKIQNTNGAGDGALSALLHDMAANDYHRCAVPNSPKHEGHYLDVFFFLSSLSLCKPCEF